MTLDEKRIAIAESHGWKWYRIPHSERHSRGPMKTLFLPAAHEIDQDPIWLVPGEPTDRIANMEYMERYGHVQDYFNDCAAAVSLCEAMAKGGHTVHVSFKERWVCQLVWDGVDFECVADTFPAAVAECYGKAKGLWE